uniref:Uncharacterized protein n=1 Tax=Cyanothece sp. (strain PCC 7425 / ATCC 29141) TaxID=395961 RepID=B8HMK1_CYAP4
MEKNLKTSADLDVALETLGSNPPYNFNLNLPQPEDQQLSEDEFLHKIDSAWLVCDRFDLQTDIWRGRILRTVRDREKQRGEGRGTGFLNWLKERDISKTRAYSLIELANSADTLLEDGQLDGAAIECFSKQAFIETAQASPEVQQLVTEAARRGDRITRRDVRQLSAEWTAVTSDLVPPIVKEKAANQALPPRYVAPLVREMEKLPPAHQSILQETLVESPDVDTLKQVTNEARYLARYLNSAAQVQALGEGHNLETALEEALRLGCLNTAADLVHQSAQLEQTIVKLYTTWKRVTHLSDQLYAATGSSTPHLRSLMQGLNQLAGEVVQAYLGEPGQPSSHLIRLQILLDTKPELDL